MTPTERLQLVDSIILILQPRYELPGQPKSATSGRAWQSLMKWRESDLRLLLHGLQNGLRDTARW